MKKFLAILFLIIILPFSSIADEDLSFEEQKALERQRLINEAEYYTTEIDPSKQLLFKCLKEKLGNDRSAEVEAKLISKKLINQLNNILKTARKDYCEAGQQKRAERFIKKSSEDAYRKVLWGTEFVTVKQCAKSISHELHNETPCFY